MNKLTLIFIVLFLTLAAGAALAQCPTSPSYGACCGVTWVNWTQDQSCYSATAGVSADTVSCYYGAGWKFDGNYTTYVTTSFTPTSSQVYNPNNWSGGSFIELNSPSASAYDWVELAAYVYHPNNTVSQYSLFFWDGSRGNLSGCAQQYGLFSASAGDTIVIRINALNGSGTATIRASVPTIFDGN